MIRIILIVFISWFGAIAVEQTCFIEQAPAGTIKVVDGSELANIEAGDDYSEVSLALPKRKSKAKSSSATETSQGAGFILFTYRLFLNDPEACIGFNLSHFTRAQRGPPALS